LDVYVFGLGHIGLPMATWIALHDYKVIGIDKNPEVIAQIQNGTVKIEEYFQNLHISQLGLNLINKKIFSVTSDFLRANDKPSIYVIAVGIVEKEDGSQDISPLNSVLETIIPTLVAGDLLLFRTTLIPGTLDQLITTFLKPLNIKIGLAYCPETLMETHAFEELNQNPMILAATDNESLIRAETFLSSVSKAPIYKASTLKTAEMVKVIQNIHRDVNIALTNEISEAAHTLGLNIYELVSLANTHPRVKLLQPGPGVGGYCLPNALGYLQNAFGDESKLPLMTTARKLNLGRPQKIVNRVNEALQSVGKVLADSTIAMIGLAMKDYCADCRNSPALEIASLFIKTGAKVQAYDPRVPITYSYQVSSMQECLLDADCLLITAHQEGIIYDRDQIAALMAKPLIVVDTRNVFPDFTDIQIVKP
jgi:UDP-N-acetyl-D-mannosaminuronic acid dehydrogenase